MNARKHGVGNSTYTSVAERLALGSPRSLGCTDVVAAEALQSPALVRELVEALGDERPVVSERAANALNKIQQACPEIVTKHGHKILYAALDSTDLRARWNLATVIGRLPLRGRDRALAVALMFEALRSDSAVLRAFAMTALVELAENDAPLRRRVQTIVEKALEDGSAAVRARARKLWTGL